MSIRRRSVSAGIRRSLRVPPEAAMEAGRSMQEGRKVIGEVLNRAADAVQSEMRRARAVFVDAEKALAGNGEMVRNAMAAGRRASKGAEGGAAAATLRGQDAAKAAMNGMMERLNQITANFGAGTPGNPPK